MCAGLLTQLKRGSQDVPAHSKIYVDQHRGAIQTYALAFDEAFDPGATFCTFAGEECSGFIHDSTREGQHDIAEYWDKQDTVMHRGTIQQ